MTPNWRLQFSYTWKPPGHEHLCGSGNPGRCPTARRNRRRTITARCVRSGTSIAASRSTPDCALRAVSSRLDAPYTTTIRVPGYVTFDLRYAYRFDKSLEVALIGRNLIGARRFEYVSDYIPTVATELAPSVLLTTRWTF